MCLTLIGYDHRAQMWQKFKLRSLDLKTIPTRMNRAQQKPCALGILAERSFKYAATQNGESSYISIAEWTLKWGTKLTSKKCSDQRNPLKSSHKAGLNRRGGEAQIHANVPAKLWNRAHRHDQHISLSALLLPCLSPSPYKMKIVYPRRRTTCQMAGEELLDFTVYIRFQQQRMKLAVLTRVWVIIVSIAS